MPGKPSCWVNEFHKIVKHFSHGGIEFESYKENSSDEVRRFSEGVINYLTQLGLQVKGATVIIGEWADGLQKIDPEQALKDIERILGKDFDARIEKSLGGKV